MEDLWVTFTAECGDLACGDRIILEYSGPWSLRAGVTSKGARQWKDLSVTAPSACWTLQSTKLKDDRRRLVAVCFSPSLLVNRIYAERRLEKEECSFCVLYNKSMYVMRLQDSNGFRWLSATAHLPFYFNFRSLDLCLLHTCFWGVLYAMLLGKWKF